MDILAASGFAVAGALAGVPIAAIAYSVPAQGRIRVSHRWWRGEPARPAAVTTVSLLTATTAGLVTGYLPPSPALPAFWLFAVLGVGLAITDLRRHRLPHAMTGTLWIACMAGVATESLVARQARPLIEAALVGAAVTMLALVIGLALPGQLGLGDVSLFGVIALSLGWLGLDTAVVGLLVGISVQSAAAFANVLRTRTMRHHMPLGPALLTGWLVAIVLERV